MPKAEDVYVNSDDLDNIPALMKSNYLYESKLLVKLLPEKSHVLQVGSMDGIRAIRLLGERPDLQLSGLEIEEHLVRLAKATVRNAGVKAKVVQ